jgi:ethanolamine utilization protein EutA
MKFTSAERALVEADVINMITLGLDIGSATSHVSLSQLTLVRGHNRYTVTEAKVIHQSPVLKTPFGGEGRAQIDGTVLESMIDDALAEARVTRDQIESGVVILTGNALRRNNAREIADVLAAFSGKFISISAGDRLESTLAAYGSGAIAASKSKPVLNVDIGGGTTKITHCVDGKVHELTAIEIGGRILQVSSDGVVNHGEPTVALFTEDRAIPVNGARLSIEAIDALIHRMADTVCQAVTGQDVGMAQRIDPIRPYPEGGEIVLSGGVSQWLLPGATGVSDDLGQRLAHAVQTRLIARGYQVRIANDPIRATVLGASQQRLQVSGNTIFISDESILPIRNIPVLQLAFDDTPITVDGVVDQVQRVEAHQLFETDAKMTALGVNWEGSVTYGRIDAFCRGLMTARALNEHPDEPLILLLAQDIAGLIGIHLKEELNLPNPIVCLDGLDQVDFDFIDVGEVLNQTGLVPVVAKSILFQTGSKV